MQSATIRSAVLVVQQLVELKDTDFLTAQSQKLADQLLEHLVVHFARNPNTAMAIMGFLVDRGFNFNRLRETPNTQAFARAFGSRIASLTREQHEVIRRIGASMCAQLV